MPLGHAHQALVRIGPSTARRRPRPPSPQRVPTLYAKYLNEPWFTSHLAWLFQKDTLTQDAFLVGPPGALRRHLALSYCELTNRPYEIVALSRRDDGRRPEAAAGDSGLDGGLR